MKRSLLLVSLFICALYAYAQVTPSPNPIPVGYTGEVVITFDATKGNGGMVGAAKCFAHTGLITSASQNTGDWKNVIGSWRGTTQPELSSIGDNLWQLTIPNIYTFYGVPESTDIKALAFVFHDGKGGSKEGKASAGDILVYLGEETEGDIWESVEGVTPVTKARPAGVSNGIYYGADGTSVTLCTYAASKNESAKRVFLLGDMTDWKLSSDYQLYKDGNYFWITLTGLTRNKEYRFQYAVERADGAKKQICDLYSEKVLHPDDQYEPKTVNPTLISYPTKGADGTFVSVIRPGKTPYVWSDATLNFKRPERNSLIIYEAWVFDYTQLRSFKGMMKRLDYLQNLGINAIELMPVSEFEGNQSWGYNPSLYFALDKSYGKPEDMKAFVDECHKRGIAVIVDFVFNHTNGTNPMVKLYPWTSSSKTETELRLNPWININPPEGDNGYGEEWNHDFEPAKEMFKRVFQYWLEEYKIDGYRLDLSHGLCGNTNNAVANLKEYNRTVQATSPGAYMILEHWGNGQSDLINDGMLCWTGAGLCSAYYQVAMGWLKPDDGGNTDALNGANKNGYVSYAESHDEERMQFKVKQYGAGDLKTNESARIARVPACVAFNVLLKGPHMLWQFEELGYDISIDQNGRTGTKPNPASKGYFTNDDRVAAFTKCAQVITLRTQLMPAAFTGTPAVNIGSKVALRTIQWSSNVFAAANFSATDDQTLQMPAGTWYDYLEGAEPAAGTYTLKPGELKVFTGSAVQAPAFEDIQKRESQGFEEILAQPAAESQKCLIDGHIYIIRNGAVYNIQGMRVE